MFIRQLAPKSMSIERRDWRTNRRTEGKMNERNEYNSTHWLVMLTETSVFDLESPPPLQHIWQQQIIMNINVISSRPRIVPV